MFDDGHDRLFVTSEVVKDAVRTSVCRLGRHMCRAIECNNVHLAGQLLKAGMPVTPLIGMGPPYHSLMVHALIYSLPIAKLLRAHNAKLTVVNEPEAVLGIPSIHMMRLVDSRDPALGPLLAPGAREWVRSAPMRGKGPVATYMHAVGIDPSNVPELHTAWPPESVSLQDFPPNMHQAILQFWESASHLRRLEARSLAPRYWRRVRSMVRARPIAVYWQQCAIERSCAPGGKQRAADLDAFVADSELSSMTA